MAKAGSLVPCRSSPSGMIPGPVRHVALVLRDEKSASCRVEIDMGKGVKEAEIRVDGFGCRIKNESGPAAPAQAAQAGQGGEEHQEAARDELVNLEIRLRNQVFQMARRLEYADTPWNGRSPYGSRHALAAKVYLRDNEFLV